MVRWAVIGVCAIGWLVLAAGVVAPVVGMALAPGQSGAVSTDLVAVPAWQTLLLRSLVLSLTPLLVASRGAAGPLALAEVDGALAADDPRFSALRSLLPLDDARPLGFYATPVRAAPAAARGE